MISADVEFSWEMPDKITKPAPSAGPSRGPQTLTIQHALDLAQQHHTAGRLAQAKSIYQRILQSVPNQPVALHLLGVIAQQGGKNDIAVDLINKALAIKPDYAEAYFALGNALQNLRKLDQAVASYRKAVAVKPDFVEAYIVLGNTLQELGKLDEAVASYRKTLAIAPEFAEVYNNLGNVLQELGKLDEAVASYRRTLAIKPNYAEAHNNLGVVLQGLGKLDEAIASFRKALAIKPDYAEAHNNLGVALRGLGKLDEAVASYRKALAIAPDHAEAHSNLGNVLQNLGKLDEAVASHRKALTIAPGYAKAHNNLGIALQGLGKLDEAVASYHKALAIAPDYAEAHSNLGNVLQNLGKLDEAVASHRKALTIAPDYAEAHNNLGVALRGLGKLDEAVASFHQACVIKPDFSKAHRGLALAKKFTEYDDDIKAMEDAYAMPNLGDREKIHLAFGLGKSFEDLRQYEKAFRFYQTGNAIKRGSYEFSIEIVENRFERVKKLFTKDLFGKLQAAGSSDETPIFVLGMLRSGTTLVEQILASHPNVYGAGELNYLNRIVTSCFRELDDPRFTESINQASIRDFSSAGGEYIGMIRDTADSAGFITDKMPYNFRLIGMIKLMLPKAKIIHCCRDPRDTCLSIFKNDFSDVGNYYAYDLGELGRYCNLYRELMKHWHSVLPGFIHDIHYEDVVADQEKQSRALLAYCGLEWDDACLEFYRTDRPVQTASAAQVRRPIYKDSVRLWKRYENQLTPLLDVLGQYGPVPFAVEKGEEDIATKD